MQISSTSRHKARDDTPEHLSCSAARDEFHSILYCAVDIAAFPAQVMAAFHAPLRDKPFVVICQDKHSHKSSVVSCSSRARQLGIDNGMPMHLVSRRWPDVAVVQRDASFEAAACGEIATVLYRYSPEYDVRGNGAAIVNLSRTPVLRTMRPQDIGAHICGDIMAAVPLSVIVAGLGATEAVARIMARAPQDMPQDLSCDALSDTSRDTSFSVCVCEAGREAQTIAGLDATMLPGLSGQCRQKLVAYGLRRIGQVQKLSKDSLVARFGAEGEKLYSMAAGGSVSLGSPRDKSFGLSFGLHPFGRRIEAPAGVYAEASPLRAETVLESDINDMNVIIQKVRHTVDKLCFLLKNNDVQTKKFTLTIKYSDNKKSQKTVALPGLTNDFLTMAQYAQQAFSVLYQRRVAIRSIMLDTKDVRPDPCQTSLFETSWEQKQAALARQIVKVRNENSFGAVVSACNLAPRNSPPISPAGGLTLKPSPCGGR
jgi:nucleotidyltransferase/DNA polymerase involved in DNA repair